MVSRSLVCCLLLYEPIRKTSNCHIMYYLLPIHSSKLKGIVLFVLLLLGVILTSFQNLSYSPTNHIDETPSIAMEDSFIDEAVLHLNKLDDAGYRKLLTHMHEAFAKASLSLEAISPCQPMSPVLPYNIADSTYRLIQLTCQYGNKATLKAFNNGMSAVLQMTGHEELIPVFHFIITGENLQNIKRH